MSSNCSNRYADTCVRARGHGGATQAARMIPSRQRIPPARPAPVPPRNGLRQVCGVMTTRFKMQDVAEGSGAHVGG